jgi:hypothetical protein
MRLFMGSTNILGSCGGVFLDGMRGRNEVEGSRLLDMISIMIRC